MEMVHIEKSETIYDAIKAIGGSPVEDMKGVYSIQIDPYLAIIIVNRERSYLSITVSRNFDKEDMHESRLNILNTDPTMGTHSVIENAYLYRQIQYYDNSGISSDEIKRILKECRRNAAKGFGFLVERTSLRHDQETDT